MRGREERNCVRRDAGKKEKSVEVEGRTERSKKNNKGRDNQIVVL